MRCKANRGFKRDEEVTDYFDPKCPSKNQEQWYIKKLKGFQKEVYDELRFKELTEKLETLQKSYGALLALRVDDVQAFKVYKDTLKKNRVRSREARE